MIMVTLCVFLLFGMLGLAYDLGRMYIHKAEAMSYVDAAAVAAARELDGTSQGGARANAAALQSWARWNFSSTDFATPTVEFATSKAGPWNTSPGTWTNVAFARVTVTVSDIKLAFLPVVGTASSGSVAHLAVAGQIGSIPQAVFPFSPIAHADYATPATMEANAPDYGFQKGGKYTFRWPNDPNSKSANLCPDDNNTLWKTKVDASNGGWRGYITSHSASVIRDEIQSDLMGSAQVPDLGEIATEFGGSGNKGTEANAMEDRVAQDTDHVTTEYYYSGTKPTGIVGAGSAWVGSNSDSYLWRQQNNYSPAGNNRRVVTVLVNAGFAQSNGTAWGASAYTAVGYGQFFLYELNYAANQHDTFCAEYLGNNPCTGCSSATALVGDGSTSYIIRLVE